GIFARHAELVDATLSVSSEEAISEMRRLARRHGLLCGPSSGAHLVAARRVRAQHPELETVVTLFCDAGEKYLQDHFSPPGDGAVGGAFAGATAAPAGHAPDAHRRPARTRGAHRQRGPARGGGPGRAHRNPGAHADERDLR